MEETHMRTTLERFEPYRGATTLQEQINRLFNESFGRTAQEASITPGAPPVDIYETEQELVVKADLPDIDPKDVDVRVENNILTIRGERKFEKEEKEENFHRIERRYGTFTRSFTLPNTVNPDSVKADFENGVLKIQFEKRAEAKPKQI